MVDFACVPNPETEWGSSSRSPRCSYAGAYILILTRGV